MSFTLIKNANIADGSGSESRAGDVAFENGMIAAVGQNLPKTGAGKIIDARGLCLAPGFIDSHGHSDISILAAPEATGKISQGVTTEIVGNCGLSAFPVTDKNREHLEELYRNYNEKLTWTDAAGYAKELSGRNPAINIVSLCGHNSLRAAVCGYEKKEISGEDISTMKELLSKNLRQGAVGFSTGLLYVPGKFAKSPEIVELLKELSSAAKPYCTHLRSESMFLVESIRESICMCAASGAPKLHISHLKTARKENWGKLDEALSAIDEGRKQDIEITADRYPYIESMTQLSIILPDSYGDLDSVSLEKKLAEPGAPEDLEKKLKSASPDRWKNIKLICCAQKDLKAMFGKSLEEIAQKTGISPERLCVDILREDSAGALAAFCGGMSLDNMRKIIRQPFVACGSDENARPEDYSIGRSHPRAFGSFPRFINMVRQSEGLEEAIRKITSLPAAIFGLKKRGLIKPGFIADMALFDPDKLKDNADFANPHALCEGIEKVFVSGNEAL